MRLKSIQRLNLIYQVKIYNLQKLICSKLFNSIYVEIKMKFEITYFLAAMRMLLFVGKVKHKRQKSIWIKCVNFSMRLLNILIKLWAVCSHDYAVVFVNLLTTNAFKDQILQIKCSCVCLYFDAAKASPIISIHINCIHKRVCYSSHKMVRGLIE